jgi:hypothetical protein
MTMRLPGGDFSNDLTATSQTATIWRKVIAQNGRPTGVERHHKNQQHLEAASLTPPGLNLKAQTMSTATAHFNFEKALLSSVPSICGAEKNLQWIRSDKNEWSLNMSLSTGTTVVFEKISVKLK